MDSNKDPIERLRSYISNTVFHPYCVRMNVMLDEIEAQYLKLPVDADGVPIFFGDLLSTIETGETFMCRGLAVCLRNETERFWTVEFDFDDYTGTPEYVSAKSCRHVNPDTVEGLLEDLALNHEWGYLGMVCNKDEMDEVIADYADRIRKAVQDEN